MSARPAAAQSVQWLQQPPKAAQGGTEIVVQWEVSGFGQDLTENAVAWGQPWVEYQLSARVISLQLLHQDLTDSQLNGNCVYTESILLPTVTENATYYFAPFTKAGWEFAFADAVQVIVTVNPAVTTYFPSQPGSQWLYQTPFGTANVVVPPLIRKLDGKPTITLQNTSIDAEQNFVCDETGLAIARNYIANPFTGQTSNITYDPPLRLTNLELVLDESVHSAGRFTNVLGGVVLLDTTYTATTTITGMHVVNTPAGAFNAFQVETFISLGNGAVDVATAWVTAGVGTVSVQGITGVGNASLLQTNLPDSAD